MLTAASARRSDGLIIVVMGVSGCGKSLVGEAIAASLGMPFLEGDTLHPAANVAKMAQGNALTDDDRFPWLDSIGARIGGAGPAGLVVSCSSLKRIYRSRLRSFAAGQLLFVFLSGSEAVLAARMAARRGHFMPPALLKSQLATLEDPSAEPDVVTVDVSPPRDAVIAEALDAIAAHLGESAATGGPDCR
jgi:gluconokinase